jgi:hypothetical protein
LALTQTIFDTAIKGCSSLTFVPSYQP